VIAVRDSDVTRSSSTVDDTFRVIGVAGTVRSGSTLLCLQLGGAPHVFAAGETSRIWRRHQAEVHKTCWCGDDPCAFWTPEFVGSCEPHVYRAVGERALRLLGRRCTVVSDKRPRMYRERLRAGDQLDGVVVIFKSPPEFVYSMHKRGVRFGKAAWEYSRVHNDALKLARKRLVPMAFVEYGSLASEPVAVLQGICRVLNMEYSPEMSAPNGAAAVHMLGGSNGLRERVLASGAVSVASDESWKLQMPDELRDQVAHSGKLRRVYDNLRKLALTG
jgi:hypothetical protein